MEGNETSNKYDKCKHNWLQYVATAKNENTETLNKKLTSSARTSCSLCDDIW